MDTDVVIIGGGPAGLIAAIAARRKGFRVVLTDPGQPGQDKACGEGLLPEGLAAAERLGIEIPADAGMRFRGIRFVEGSHAVQADFREGSAMAVRRTRLHVLLAEEAARQGVECRWGRPAFAGDESFDADEKKLGPRWTVGADGGTSRVRRWAGLERFRRNETRYGFRRHFAVEPWTSYVEVHWGDGCQLSITPVGRREVGVSVLSRDARLRIADALPRFPEIERRLRGAEATSRERGGCTVARVLRRVTREGVALVGDASGSVDAITGDGISLAFQQAEALAEAMVAEDLNRYEAAHRRIAFRPMCMGDFMLFMDRHPRMRARAQRALASRPTLFEDLLALHTGNLSGMGFARMGVALGWRLVTA